MTIRYQFQNGVNTAPVRDTWEEAAADAVAAGAAHWDSPHTMVMPEGTEAKIRPIREKTDGGAASKAGA
jgi:hypothetical protein